ncbi:MAG: hypothetical protein ACI9XO_000448 [Paraglaciecola sp.]|jgi:hypothetical protein
MFTINIYLRFALIALFLVGGIIATFLVGIVWSWLPLLIGIALLVGYILLGTVQSASQMMQMNDFLGADDRLDLTVKPDWLYVTNRAYFYILKGTIASQLHKDWDKAEKYLTKAESLELPSDNEKAAVKLQLANIAATRNKWKEAKLIFRQMKDLKVTESSLKDQIKQFEKAIAQSGQMQSAQRMGGGGRRGGGAVMNPGGKRRRPKMR